MYAEAGATVPEPTRGATEPRDVEPTAAAQHPVLSRSWSRRIFRRTVGVVILAKPIIAPLIYIPVHVMEAPCVCPLLSDRMRLSAAVAAVPSHVVQISVSAVRPYRTRTACVLPFGIRRQARPAGHLSVELADEPLAVFPRNRIHRAVVTSEL